MDIPDGWAASAVMVRPGSNPAPPPDRLPDVVISKVANVPTRRTTPTPPPVIEIAERAPIVLPAPKVEPVEVAPELYPAPEPIAVKRAAKAVEIKTLVREPVVRVAVAQPRPKLSAAAEKSLPAPVPRLAAPTDLASLDQFVMSFYGQSWRFGDARKRAALEQSRTLFVVRRAACAIDSCKRSEYLRLQREVSAIVESGQQR